MQQTRDEGAARRTPEAVREDIRQGIRAALASDSERRGGRVGAQLLLSGLIGVAGTLGVTWLVAAHPMHHHPDWHLAFYSAVWAGLLVCVCALAMIDVRTPRWPIGSAARAALLALGVAGVCAALCPDQHFLAWWSETELARAIDGLAPSGLPGVLCFGFVWTAAFALVASLPTLPRRRLTIRALTITAALIVLLQTPGIALQSVGHPSRVFAAWLAGTAIGSAAGVAAASAILTRWRFTSRPLAMR